MSHRIASLIVISLIVSLLSAATGKPKFDGHWWNSSAKSDREGFLAGYVDCSISEAKKSTFDVQWNNYEPKITEYYNAHADDVEKPVIDVFARVIQQYPQDHITGGDVHAGPHGIFNGDYWRQMPDERNGFVDGFLTCYEVLPQQKAAFSKASSWYVSEISRWYGVKDDDPSEIDEKRVDAPIATALFKFQDTAKPTTARHGKTAHLQE